MKRFFYLLIILILVFFCVFCGKKGPILAPLIKIPGKIEAVNAIQKGDKIILTWKNPATYSEGSPMSEVESVEIWLLKEDEDSSRKEMPVKLEKFEEIAELILSIKNEKFPEYQKAKFHGEFNYYYCLAPEEFVSKRLIFSLRIKDRRKKESAFSELIYVKPKILSLPPINIRASVFEDRIEIQWDFPEGNIDQSLPPELEGYNIYRKEGDGIPIRLNTKLIKEEKYEDKGFLFGGNYFYFIRTSSTDSSPYLESDDSETIEVLAKDIFPPSQPNGLVAVAGENIIALSWNANQEEDLAGYRVWRKEEGEDEYKLLDPRIIKGSTYNDITIGKNKRYYYAVTAQDKSRNESQKSGSVSEVVKENLQ